LSFSSSIIIISAADIFFALRLPAAISPFAAAAIFIIPYAPYAPRHYFRFEAAIAVTSAPFSALSLAFHQILSCRRHTLTLPATPPRAYAATRLHAVCPAVFIFALSPVAIISTVLMLSPCREVLTENAPL
jgi:hypothetical protein